MKKSFLKYLLFSGLVLSFSAGALAKPSDQTIGLDDIVVTSTKVKKELMEVPAAVSVITSSEIQEQGHNELVKFLKSVPGLHVSMDAGGTNFSVRGQKVNMGAGVMIYIDGRRAVYSGGVGSSTSQAHKLDDFPIEMIEKIEVIKAPAGSIYGGGAAHGIIHIHTKRPQKGDRNVYGDLSASYGYWGSRKVNLTLRGMGEKLDYAAMVQAKEIDGYREIDKKNYLGEFYTGFRINEENHIGVTVGINKSSRKYPDNFQLESDLKANRRSGRVRIPARPGFGNRPGKPAGYQYPTESDSSLFYGDLNYQGKIRGVDINSAFHVTHLAEDYLEPGIVYDDNTRGKDETDDRSNDILEYNLSLKKTVLENGNFKDTLTAGLDYEHFVYDNKNNRSKSTTVKTTSKRYGFFANNEIEYGKLSFLSGLRFDRQDWDLENGHSDSYGGRHEKISWDLGPSYRVNEKMTLFYSVGKSYWFPSAFHLSMPSWFGGSLYAPTPETQVPEENLTHELGIKHVLSEYLTYNLTVYRIESKHKYVASYDKTVKKYGGFVGYKPGGNSTSRGVEFEIYGRIFDWWAYRGSVSYTDSTWDKGTTTSGGKEDISGKKLTDIPVWQYTAGMTFFPMEKLSLAIDMNHERKSYADTANKHTNASLLSFDARINYTPFEKFSLYLLGTNIFDREYDKQSGREYDPRPGRYMEIGVTYKF